MKKDEKKALKRSDFKALAEKVGFEPTGPVKGLLDFESRPL